MDLPLGPESDLESWYHSESSERRRRLGEVLIDAGTINQDQLDAALAEHVQSGRRERLGRTITRLGYTTDEAIARALASQLGLEFGDAVEIETDIDGDAIIPRSLAEQHAVAPVQWEEAGTLVLACTDPTDVIAYDDIRLVTGARTLKRLVVTSATLAMLHEQAYGNNTDDLLEHIEDDEPEALEEEEPLSVRDAPIVRLVQHLLLDAVAARASDIHIEPGPQGTVVRYRIDGVLHRSTTIPRTASPSVLSRIKIITQMDIAERRLPQDGRMRLRTTEGNVDIRASTLPSMHGETIVLRVLRQGDQALGLEDVGLDEEHRQTLLRIIRRPQGLLLLTGPTGSGKTSTLYALLREMASESRNVVTLEDPVEYELEGVNQTQINARIGLTFPRSLRTVLRQDPDVVMVGEIRDPETAELALQASLTGHLVLSTLHTNDAPGAVVRLRDLGIPSYLVASALTTVIAQRLARRLCAACARPDDTHAEHELLGIPISTGHEFYKAVGCQRCQHTGYHGRVGLFEVLSVEGQIAELIAADASAVSIRQAGLRQGMRSLRYNGVAKAQEHVTSLQEVLRVIPADSEDGTCTACAQPVEPDFAHCPWCGAILQAPHCAQCGCELLPGWRLCPRCGEPCAPLEPIPPAAPAWPAGDTGDDGIEHVENAESVEDSEQAADSDTITDPDATDPDPIDPDPIDPDPDRVESSESADDTGSTPVIDDDDFLPDWARY